MWLLPLATWYPTPRSSAQPSVPPLGDPQHPGLPQPATPTRGACNIYPELRHSTIVTPSAPRRLLLPFAPLTPRVRRATLLSATDVPRALTDLPPTFRRLYSNNPGFPPAMDWLQCTASTATAQRSLPDPSGCVYGLTCLMAPDYGIRDRPFPPQEQPRRV